MDELYDSVLEAWDTELRWNILWLTSHEHISSLKKLSLEKRRRRIITKIASIMNSSMRH
jgi:hypothetical protein